MINLSQWERKPKIHGQDGGKVSSMISSWWNFTRSPSNLLPFAFQLFLEGWGCCSVIEHMLCMCEALGSIPSGRLSSPGSGEVSLDGFPPFLCLYWVSLSSSSRHTLGSSSALTTLTVIFCNNSLMFMSSLVLSFLRHELLWQMFQFSCSIIASLLTDFKGKLSIN